MKHPSPWLHLLFAFSLALPACSSATTDRASATIPPTTSGSTTTASTSATSSTSIDTASNSAEPEPAQSSVYAVPAPELTSVGQVTIDKTEYPFTFECYAAGAGDVLALGVGTDPGTGESTESIVQAFFGQPYVAVVVEDGTVFELAIDRQAELFVQDGSIQGSALRFVAASGAGAGVGTELGLGSVWVDCDGFAGGLPDGYEVASQPNS